MTTVYLVCGRTGEYSDANEWRVAAFTSEANAQARVLLCTRLAHALYAARAGKYECGIDEEYAAWKAALAAAQAEDERVQCDYTGTTYWIEPLEVLP